MPSKTIVGRQPQPHHGGASGRYATSPEREKTPYTSSTRELHGRPSTMRGTRGRDAAMRADNALLIEQAGVGSDIYMRYDPATDISQLGQMAYWTAAHTLILYTFVMVILTGLQTNTIHLTVRSLLWIVGAHNVLSFMVLGMHSKLQSRSSLSKQRGLMHSFDRHVRNDRRTILWLLNGALSFVATVHLFFVAQIITDIDVDADDFRDTGINMFLNRSLDLIYVFILMMGVPAALLVLAESRFYYLTYYRKNPESESEREINSPSLDIQDDEDNSK